MDKGAHFHKCDFQVHSPRDIRWTGAKFGVDLAQIAALTDEEKEEITNNRVQFSKEYLQKVRDSGLNSIAITDHHDITFAKIIRQVAEAENRQFIIDGNPEKCIIVFPGIELTLSTPICQCLILFDADIPDQHLDTALSMFGIVPSHEFVKQTAETLRISTEQIAHLNHLHKKLDDQPLLKGRYLLLPNVNYNGASTLLRSGQHEHYKKMPCVGGYVDGSLATDTGWINKLNGGDVNYGNKALGLLSTSDNRFEDGREFGNYYTWVKWAEPSAEALRQACLARQSRISQVEPVLPQITISKLDVTNSKFLGSFSIEFNKQYNALIGGRGTGKSTILEYLRWGLCDQTVSSSDPDEQTELERRRKKLVDKTLTDFRGEVRITFILNGVNHIIRRNSVNGEITLKIDVGEFQIVTEDEVRKILPIQAYSQKQLSGVGVSTGELKRFIQIPISNELANFDFDLSEIVKLTQDEYLNFSRKKEIEVEIEQINLEITSLNNQVRNLRSSLTGVSVSDQGIISKKPIYDTENGLISNIQRELNTVVSKITELEAAVQIYPEPLPTNLQTENLDLINRIDAARSAKFIELKALITQLKGVLSAENSAELRGLIADWKLIKENFDTEYEVAKGNTTSNQQQLIEIQRIEARLSQLQESLSDRVAKLREIGNPEDNFNELRTLYWLNHRDKATLLGTQANEFSQLSNGQIKVEVEKNIDLALIKSELTKVLTGTRINTDKIQSLSDGISESDDPLAQWEIILNELRLLAELKIVDGTVQTLPSCPKLTEYGLNEGNLRKIAEILSGSVWLNLATMKIEFTPDFKYSTNSELGDVIPFADASAGQQATALLTVLLNQPGTPLLIDQPEDDIDNRAIDEIMKKIWEAKKHRQLIFTSHNANLVVNGDAELVVCCDYKDAGSLTRGIIKAEGAIDSKIVKDEITSIMEGGEKAFKLRKDKYGF